jgi:hypothetical protein
VVALKKKETAAAFSVLRRDLDRGEPFGNLMRVPRAFVAAIALRNEARTSKLGDG